MAASQRCNAGTASSAAKGLVSQMARVTAHMTSRTAATIPS